MKMIKSTVALILTLAFGDAMAFGFGMGGYQPPLAAQYGMSGGAIGFGGPGMMMPQVPGMGIGPPPRINPQNFNLPPPQYQTIWDGNCRCYRPFQPGYNY